MPAALIGDRKEGYARLAGDGARSLHVRWHTGKPAKSLRPALDGYLERLRRDAQKAKLTFRSEVAEEQGTLLYKWQSEQQGRGVVFRDADAPRMFFLEVVGARKDSLLPVVRGVRASFHTHDGDRELWSVAGVGAWLPKGMKVAKKQFLAGRASLQFEVRGTMVRMERWSFAEQLVAKHGLTGWAHSALALPMEPTATSEFEASLRHSKWMVATEALVRLRPEANQIEALVLRTRRQTPRLDPSWWA